MWLCIDVVRSVNILVATLLSAIICVSRSENQIKNCCSTKTTKYLGEIFL